MPFDQAPTPSIQDPAYAESIASRMNRRELLQRVSALGLTLPSIGWLVTACGGEGTIGSSLTPTPQPTTAPTATVTARPQSPTASPTSQSARFSPDRPPAVPDAARLRTALVGDTVAIAGGVGDPFLQILSEKFQDETGVVVRSVELPAATRLYDDLLRLTTAQSPDADIFIMDVTWPGSLASHLIDLSPWMGADVQAHDPALAASMTVDGRLVAMPGHLNFGMLYYRTDLLARYGYAAVPATWDELEEMAAVIQEGERASNPSFAGYVFQGINSEGLTCNALEWIASNGGGHIIDESGVTLDNSAAITMLERASRWVGEIAPRGVLAYDEDASRRHFQAGSAAFMRNWAWVWWTGNQPGEPSAGKFDVAPLPSGPSLPRIATTGGQAFGVSAYSLRQNAAAEMVRYLTCADVQRWQAVVNLLQPTIPALYDDPDVLAVFPFRERVRDVRLVPRPSNVAGAVYEQVSATFSTGVTEILETGKATEIVPRMADEIRTLLG